MRTERIVRTLETGKAVTSLEVQRDGSFLATADGSEARARARPASQAEQDRDSGGVGEQAAPYAPYALADDHQRRLTWLLGGRPTGW